MYLYWKFYWNDKILLPKSFTCADYRLYHKHKAFHDLLSLNFHEHVFVCSKYNFIANVHVCVQDEKSLTLYIHINSIVGKTVVTCVNWRENLSIFFVHLDQSVIAIDTGALTRIFIFVCIVKWSYFINLIESSHVTVYYSQSFRSATVAWPWRMIIAYF